MFSLCFSPQNSEKTPWLPIPAPIGSRPSARQLPTSPPLPSALPYARDIHFTSVRSRHVFITFGRPRNRCNREKKPWLLIPAPIVSYPTARMLPAPPAPHPSTPTASAYSPGSSGSVLYASGSFLTPGSRPTDRDQSVRHRRKFWYPVRSPLIDIHFSNA